MVLTCTECPLIIQGPGTPALATRRREQVTVEGPEELPGPLPRASAALQYITAVAPVTSDSKYDFSCQAADRKQNIIYCQIQPTEAHTWLLEARATEAPRAGFPRTSRKGANSAYCWRKGTRGWSCYLSRLQARKYTVRILLRVIHSAIIKLLAIHCPLKQGHFLLIPREK